MFRHLLRIGLKQEMVGFLESIFIHHFLSAVGVEPYTEANQNTRMISIAGLS